MSEIVVAWNIASFHGQFYISKEKGTSAPQFTIKLENWARVRARVTSYTHQGTAIEAKERTSARRGVQYSSSAEVYTRAKEFHKSPWRRLKKKVDEWLQATSSFACIFRQGSSRRESREFLDADLDFKFSARLLLDSSKLERCHSLLRLPWLTHYLSWRIGKFYVIIKIVHQLCSCIWSTLLIFLDIISLEYQRGPMWLNKLWDAFTATWSNVNQWNIRYKTRMMCWWNR